MDLIGFFSVAMYQLATARDAPVPIVLASIIVGLTTWWVMRWRNAAVVHNLKRGIARRDGELATLRAHIPMGTDGEETIADTHPRGRGAVSADRRKALRLVVNAIDQAELALQANDAREQDRAQDRAISSMALALQTVNRVFGLPVPGLGASAGENLATGRMYLEEVRPALRGGQDEDARRAAVAFLANAEVARLHEREQPGRIAG